MSKPFDVTSKHLFENHPRDWLTLVGWPVPPTDAGVTMVDTDLSTVSSAADKLVRVEIEPTPYLAHVEFQTSGDADLDNRMLLYNVLARSRHKLPVRSVVFLFRPEASAGPTGRVSEHLDDQSWINFSYRLVRLWELPVESLLNGPVGTLPLAPLAVKPAELANVIDRINHRLRAEVSPQELSETLECTRLLMGMRFDPQTVESLMASLAKVLEDSSTYQDTIRRGMEKGLSKGLSQGRMAGQLELLIRLGTEKFGPPADAVISRLNAMTDAVQIDRVATRLLRATSWNDLFDGQ
jgi:predicted transposase YdaD